MFKKVERSPASTLELLRCFQYSGGFKLDLSAGRAPGHERSLSASEMIAVLYIALPVVVFFLGFLRPQYGFPCLIALSFVLFKILREVRPNLEPKKLKQVMIMATLAALLCILSGYSNWILPKGDWTKHYSLLNILATNPWPPTLEYQDQLGILRYSVAWYLIPSLVSKATGLSVDTAVHLWSLIGLTTFFYMLGKMAPRWRYLAPSIFILFSGADIIGTWYSGWKISPVHIEWWNGFAELPSNLTSLLWTPQHAIASWLAVSLMIFQIKRREGPDLLPLVLSCLPLWSPFIVIGVLPLGLAYYITEKKIMTLFRPQVIATGVFVGFPILAYLLSGSTELPRSLVWQSPCVMAHTFRDAPCATPTSYIVQSAVEVAPVTIGLLIISTSAFRPYILASASFLILLPIFRLGQSNDLVMRSSIPSLAILFLLSAAAMCTISPKKTWFLWLTFVAGFATPAFEIYGSTFSQSSSDYRDATFTDRPEILPYLDQYFAKSLPPLIKKTTPTALN
ncbi:hypothetical protein GGQ73_003669 [Rhizobium skierniewicense]|uniref:Uncharacterized protein n=1 Tax=Rhizobium skierniewicense TaxID=984260 RepID=A0A7W6CC66_9HYPH|nr:hypothetical protein [Rhizobium skierniewicense]MBB3947698.1 hypothetical protein [Rhizobium skierniewicense]